MQHLCCVLWKFCELSYNISKDISSTSESYSWQIHIRTAAVNTGNMPFSPEPQPLVCAADVNVVYYYVF